MSKIQEELKTLIDSIDDTDMINKLVNLNKACEEDEKEYQILQDKYVALQKDYKEAVLHGVFDTKPQDELSGPKEVDFMDVVNSIINKN